MQQKLSAKQQELLQYLNKAIAEEGGTPSLRQAAADLKISHAAVAQRLQALQKKGYIKRPERYSRTVHVLHHSGRRKSAQRLLEIPVIGRIQAGLPMYAQQEFEDSLLVDRQLFSGNTLFALRIRGDSMRDAAIVDGDFVICEARQYAENGEIVVALIDNEEATVKRFFLYADRIELRPENRDFQPIFYPFNRILIQGKVIGVIRISLPNVQSKNATT